MPYPHKVNLLADTEAARRSCSSVGIPPLENTAPVWLARDSEDTLRVKRLPVCSFENGRLRGRACPRTRRSDEHHDKNRPGNWHRHSLLWPARIRGLFLKAAVQIQ